MVVFGFPWVFGLVLGAVFLHIHPAFSLEKTHCDEGFPTWMSEEDSKWLVVGL